MQTDELNLYFKCYLQTIHFKSKNETTNHLHITYIYLNVCKQMTNVKLLLVHGSAVDHLTVCKQMIKSK